MDEQKITNLNGKYRPWNTRKQQSQNRNRHKRI